jgi:hypothetical protein
LLAGDESSGSRCHYSSGFVDGCLLFLLSNGTSTTFWLARLERIAIELLKADEEGA